MDNKKLKKCPLCSVMNHNKDHPHLQTVKAQRKERESKNKEIKNSKQRDLIGHRTFTAILLAIGLEFKNLAHEYPRQIGYDSEKGKIVYIIKDENLEKRRKFMRGMVHEVLGTQEPVLRLRTGPTIQATSSGVFAPVVSMDVTGTADWTSFATIFDEYRILRAKLYSVPLQEVTPIAVQTAATILQASMPVVWVVDYDDGAALTTITQALAYDTFEIQHLSGTQVDKILPAKPQGMPDMQWVTTATPTIPFYWKCYNFHVSSGTCNLADTFIELEIEFRQVD